jgi:hypothetical protein
VRAAPIRCGAAVSLTGQTGQSEEIHSPEACVKRDVSRIWPDSGSMAVVCTVAISCWPRLFRTISSPLANEA